MRYRLIVHAALAAAAIAASAPTAFAFEITGLYGTSEGQLSLWQDPSTGRWIGEYGDDGGRIDAEEFREGAINGIWMENSSNVRCETERGGTYYWGGVTLFWNTTNSIDSRFVLPGSFRGRWTYCDKPDSGKEWVGIRLKAEG